MRSSTRSTGSCCKVPELGHDLTGCAELLRRGDPDRFRAAMAAPVAARRVLFPIYAFNVEVSRAPWMTQESMIAEMRLQWWRDALEEIKAGSVVRRHEVVTPLSTLLDADTTDLLDELVAARRWDCYKDPFEDAAHLDRYLTATSGNLMQVACHLLGNPKAPGLRAGYGLGVANWLLACPELEAQKRIPLVDGSADGIRLLARSGLTALQQARIPFAGSVLPAFWPASGAEKVLKAAIRAPHRVAQGTLPRPGRAIFALKALLGRK